jgi:hypothetical protein
MINSGFICVLGTPATFQLKITRENQHILRARAPLSTPPWDLRTTAVFGRFPHPG